MKETTKALIRWYTKKALENAGTEDDKCREYLDKANALQFKENEKNSGGATACGEPKTQASPEPFLKNRGRCVEGLEDLVTRVTNRQPIAPAPVSHLAEFLEPL